ncbi:hypothetical protein [Demequina litorisediminis]|uniref:Ribbon-helix-helix protein CopG domain-containing protein n=1 Tax=Demequina litorisediminis TaxID=1849022 RepID=A0ABQ6IIN1_9MICO|nr:hypothetical protein [Demequina litorisediminis]GMA37782.1 hypothetical protein GCM10025876_39860 [Demequina litorisediminis]GMA37898.1 hypothetical protein GCM10025876_41020 [Demequina litorisediminis]
MSDTTDRDAALDAFAADPTKWGQSRGTLTGADAAAHGRALLESAGVDVEAIERSAGRPRLDRATNKPGQRSPRVNVAVTDAQDRALARLVGPGRKKSDIVRDAIDEYLAAHA